MNGREELTLSSASYYFSRGVGGSGAGSGSGAGTQAGLPTPPGFKPLSNPNPNISVQSNVRGGSMGSAFQMEYSPPPNFPHGVTVAVAASALPVGDSGKKKRGRPRKYCPDGANMSLGLSPLSALHYPGSMSLTPKRTRVRPTDSGRKQRLALLGEWMNSSVGLAFTPHVIHIDPGEGRFEILCLSVSYLLYEVVPPAVGQVVSVFLSVVLMVMSLEVQ